jgi:hypothetical protein
VFKHLKRRIKKMFREFLVYHHSSMEYRAKVITLMVTSDGEMMPCEEQVLEKIAHTIYGNDRERAEILIDTVHEYHTKITTNNGLNFEHLIELVAKESREVPRFVSKINIARLRQFQACIEDEEEKIFQERIITFLQDLKEEHQIAKG